jgi:hypothetical protein
MNWTLADFLPSWVDVAWTVGILSAAGLFFRERFAKLIDAKIQHRHNAELEKLQDELSRSSKEIDTLRTSILSLRAQRQAGIEKRRLEAIDQLWAAVKALQPRKGEVAVMAVINFENAARDAQHDSRVRELFESIGGGKLEEEEAIPQHQAHEAQPYLSPLAWALFYAYQAAIAYSFMQLSILKTGVGPDVIKSPEEMVALLSAALPDWKVRLEKFGTAMFLHAVDELEKRLLAELRRIIAGEEEDAEHIAASAQIAARIEEARQKQREAQAKEALTAGKQDAATNAALLAKGL